MIEMFQRILFRSIREDSSSSGDEGRTVKPDSDGEEHDPKDPMGQRPTQSGS